VQAQGGKGGFSLIRDAAMERGCSRALAGSAARRASLLVLRHFRSCCVRRNETAIVDDVEKAQGQKRAHVQALFYEVGPQGSSSSAKQMSRSVPWMRAGSDRQNVHVNIC
jgi:hypothetical protein